MWLVTEQDLAMQEGIWRNISRIKGCAGHFAKGINPLRRARAKCFRVRHGL
jgi:hypothetical protein